MRAYPQPADATNSKIELADIVRAYGAAFRAAHRLSRVQMTAMRAIETCRTAALGGHVEQCDTCGTVRFAYHACRNRHCPKCQTLAKERWLAQQRTELLPVPYFHVVFTLPHALNALAQGNPRLIYGLLCKAAAETLLAFGENPRWLGGEIGVTLVLHTWGQNLNQHLHVHALVTGGGLHADGHWIAARKDFLFPVQALSAVFRGQFLAALDQAFAAGQLNLAGTTASLVEVSAHRRVLTRLRDCPWVVYAKQSFGGPAQVLDYLGRYTHRVAIANQRLLSFADGQVRFRWKDYAHGNRRKVMCLDAAEFIRRFLLHVLPKGFMRIRHYGLTANRAKHSQLERARRALHQPVEPPSPPESVETFWLRGGNIRIHQCPLCASGMMRIVASFTRQRPPTHGPPPSAA